MRETFKTLSLFSATLLVLLFISSGCVVNIPGCGRRSLPLFKKVEQLPVPAQAAQPESRAAALPSAESPPLTPPAAENAPSAPIPTPAREIPVLESTNTPTPGPSPTPTATPTPTPWEVERLAFVVHENGQEALYSMNTDGSVKIAHTAPGRKAFAPLWSPDGKTLAFLSDPGGHLNLYLMEKGEHISKAATHFEDYSPPDLFPKPPFSWDPRSERLAFIYQGRIWLWSRKEDSPKVLAQTDTRYEAVDVEWAPRRENRYIAFLLKTGRNSAEVWIARPHLSDSLRLAVIEGEDLGPLTWRPDTGALAFRAGRGRIAAADVEGLGSTPLYTSNEWEFGPILRYPPVETATPPLLTLARLRGESAWKVATLTDSKLQVFDSTAGASFAAWSPDGRKIAYTTDRGELYLMDADGKGKVYVTGEGVEMLDWSKK